MMLPKSKRSQLTLFVIVAIIIVAIIALLVVLMQKNQQQYPVASPSTDPEGFIKDCAKISAAKAQNSIIPNGGFLNPSDTVKFSGIKIPWMCYSSGTDEICTNKHPLLLREMEKEIYDLVLPDLEKCFTELANTYSNNNYKQEGLNFSVAIVDGKINLGINRKISYTKSNVAVSMENFNTRIFSPLYDFGVLTQEIISEEVDCDCPDEICNADLISIARYNRDYDFTRVTDGYYNKRYSIKELDTGKEFSFAVRNCAAY